MESPILSARAPTNEEQVRKMLSKIKAVTILAIGLLAVAVFAAVSFYFSQPQSQALAGNAGNPQAAPIHSEPVSPPAIQAAKTEVLAQTVHDIKIEVTSAKIIKTGVEIGVCYTTPDNGEWYSFPGHLFYETYEIYPDEVGLVDEKQANKDNPGKRCEVVRYRINDLESISTPLHFSITEIMAIQREMYSPCEEFEQRLNSNSKAHAYGLKAKCTETAEGKVAVELVGHGKSVDKDKAKKALEEIASAQVIGPWEFTINSLEPLP